MTEELRENWAGYSVVGDGIWRGQWSGDNIAQQVRDMIGGQEELPNIVAVSIAAGWAGNDSPAVTQLAQTGRAPYGALMDDLSRIRQDYAPKDEDRDALDMLSTWAMNYGRKS